ncbi:tetratricopeptide repeat protein [Haliovirga abyssi]|uniref:Tetratricopeptide repeat protein n=1 Tax=Haliovirga abyssi TaxID=2996794 RepID=A0AAU9DD11_9FUSO|nr:tetratricopeptide repeat protein [Haliovirga abyssi]BDU50192.1 hypothetical protein HLVA_07610 [Haliovirga abyssi]
MGNRKKCKKILLIFIVLLFTVGCSNIEKKKVNKEETYYIIKGLNLMQASKYAEALQSFFAAYKYEKENETILKNIGIAYSELGSYDNGEQYLKRALEINAEDAEALYNLAVIYYNRKEYKSSLEILNKISPEYINQKVIVAKVYTYYRLGDYNKSYNELTEIFKTNRYNYNLELVNLNIKLMEKLKNTKQIYSFVYNIYSKHRENENYVVFFVNYLLKIKAYDEAFKTLKEYGIKNEFSSNISYELAKLEYKRKNYNQALKYMNLVKSEDALNHNILKLKADIYKEIGEIEKSKKIYNILENIKGND